MRTVFVLPDSQNPDETHSIVLSINDSAVMNIDRWYETACTAEYIMDNYSKGYGITEDIAMKIATDIRARMSKYNETEDEAICEILSDDFDPDDYRA